MKKISYILLILSFVLLLGGCVANGDKKNLYIKNCKENALTYVKEKYGFTAEVEDVKLSYKNNNPIPSFIKEYNGKATVKMRYEGKSFKVGIYANENYIDEGVDNYQLEDFKQAFLEELQEPLQRPLQYAHFAVHYRTDKTSNNVPQNMFPMTFKFDKSHLYDALKHIRIEGFLFTEDEQTLEPIQNSKLFQEDIELGIVNFKTGIYHDLMESNAYSYSNHMEGTYKKIQRKYTKDLQDSLLTFDGKAYYSGYTPRYQNNILYYTFDKNGVLNDAVPTISIGTCDPTLFQDVQKSYEIYQYSSCVTIEKNAPDAIIYIPNEEMPQPLEPVEDDTYIISLISTKNRNRISSSQYYDYVSTDIYKDNEYTQIIITSDESVSLCEAEVKAYE